MNKQFSLRWHWFLVFAGFAIILLTGCEPFPGNDKFYEIKVAPEKLQQIETLELEQATAEEKSNPSDANEIPPENLDLTLEQCRALV